MTTSLSCQGTCKHTENGGGAIFCLPVFPLTEVDGGSQVVDVGDEDELLALLQEPFQESAPLEGVVDISVTRRVPAPATGTDIYSEIGRLLHSPTIAKALRLVGLSFCILAFLQKMQNQNLFWRTGKSEGTVK